MRTPDLEEVNQLNKLRFLDVKNVFGDDITDDLGSRELDIITEMWVGLRVSPPRSIKLEGAGCIMRFSSKASKKMAWWRDAKELRQPKLNLTA